jgi:2-polyprenyl-6-hydroxyphenyl methylase/3-demethylubiquinone-9 3-methyltransferase
MENIDELKHSKSNAPCYILSNSTVFISPTGVHYTRYLDESPTDLHPVDELTDNEISYIENQLQSNSNRFDKQVKIVMLNNKTSTPCLLDVGCGGGLFMAKLEKHGYHVTGLELNNSRASYCEKRYNINIIRHSIESDYWLDCQCQYDIVTLWDVIEHVNYPKSTLKSILGVLKKDGLLFIDTPCRDSFYHVIGELSYRLSRGRFPLFLNAMYSDHPFGHKQIFATYELKNLLVELDYEIVCLEKFHELSFPYLFYLKKILKFELLAKMTLPFVGLFLFLFPIKNKMLIVARKK